MTRRGDVVLVSLDPVVSPEQGKTRPAVVVSNDRANKAADRLGIGVVTVVPMTTNVRHVYPFQVLVEPGVSGLAEASKAQAEQVRSVTIQRIVRVVGRLTAEQLARLDEALALHLGL